MNSSMEMKHRLNIADLPFVLSFDAFPNSLIDKSTNNCIVFTDIIYFYFITIKCRTTAGMTLDFKENVLFSELGKTNTARFTFANFAMVALHVR